MDTNMIKMEQTSNDMKNAISDAIIDLLNDTYEKVAQEFGKDIATGYVLGLEEVHLMIVGKTIREKSDENKK